LYYVAKAIQAHPAVEIIYSDEDKITKRGKRLDPYFKPDFDYELLLSQNMVSHLGVYKLATVRKVGGFRVGLEGSQDYDLLLRVLEHCDPEQIIHIPRPLYHWRISKHSVADDINIKPYAIKAGIRALTEHLKRRSIPAQVVFLPEVAAYRVDYPLPKATPSVALILHAQSLSAMLTECVNSILTHTEHPNYHIILCLPRSAEQYIEDHPPQWGNKVIIKYHDYELASYAQVVNKCVSSSTVDFVCFIDHSLTGFAPGWLSALLGQAIQANIGAVAPKIYFHNNVVYSSGIILLPETLYHHLSRGEEQVVNGYFGWAKLCRGYSALSEKCMLVSKEHFQAVGGFDDTYLSQFYAGIDLCLKLKERGLRNVLRPSVELFLQEKYSNHGGEEVLDQNSEIERVYFRERWIEWVNNDPAFNPNLTIIDGGKFLVNLSPPIK
jgi:O-antigen biosynthesis protein